MTLSRGHAWVIAIAATLTMTVSYIDRQAFAVLSPTVNEALGIDNTEYGWLQSAFSIAYLFATPLGGWWIARIGPRHGLVISVIVWSSVAAAHALVPGFGMLFALRIALGFAEGPSYPGAAHTMQAVLPPVDRARGFGVLFSGSSIGGMIVPPLASLLFALWGWRSAFLMTAVVGLLWVPLWIGLTSHPAVKQRIDASVTRTRTSMFVMLRHRAVQRALVSILVAAPPVGFMLAFGAKYLHTTFDVKQEEVGRYLWLPPLLFDAGAIVFGDLCQRLRRGNEPPRLLYAISMVLTVTLALLPAATDEWMGIGIVGISVLGAGGLYTLTVADAYARVPTETVALAGGLIACAQSVALIILFPIIGALIDNYGQYDGVAIGIALWVLPGGLIWLAWRPSARP